MAPLLLILDIDETLVFGTETPLPDRTPDFRAGPFSLYRRPHLDAFLTEIGQNFELAIWSSASTSYVREITSALFPDLSRLRFVWSCDRCTRRYDPEFQETYYAKNLDKVRKLGFSLERILIVDDSPEKVSRHYGNHIRIIPFTGDPHDRELQKLLPYLVSIRDIENVRKLEKRHWHTFSANTGS
jgi:RNA polymerase II subunit A small phosphatase-like protein